MAKWRPGRVKRALALEEPYEDVPPHLIGPLLHWVQSVAWKSAEVLYVLATSLRLANWADPRTSYMAQDTLTERLTKEAVTRPEALLDYVEVLLSIDEIAWRYSKALDEILLLANSAYRVRSAGDGLELRIAPGVRETVQQAVNSAGASSSGEHLTAAWNAAYGRTSDPVKAYSEAIKAVEAAAVPVVQPSNSKATLGTVLGELKREPDLWRFRLGDTGLGREAVIALMRSLWQGQTSRHGGTAPTRPESPEEAKTAVHIAAGLVQFFASGDFSRIP